MKKLLCGNAYDLEKLIRIEGYHGFILESGAYDCDNEEKIRKCDLGMRRILEIWTEEAYLILVGGGEIIFIELNGDCRISDIIRRLGCKCSIIAEYGKRYNGSWETWDRALNKLQAVFSENGYALQYSGWLDYTFYQFELNILKEGWVVIDGQDISAFRFWNVDVNIMGRAKRLIEKSLEKKWNISGTDLSDLLIEHQLKEHIEYLYMDER